MSINMGLVKAGLRKNLDTVFCSRNNGYDGSYTDVQGFCKVLDLIPHDITVLK